MKQREDLLQKMKQRLLEKRQELTKLLQNIADKGDVSPDIKDSADEASSTLMNRLQSSLQAAEVEELKEVDEALVRIEKGTYGICINCEEPISAKRLECYPYAARCISCQELLEG